MLVPVRHAGPVLGQGHVDKEQRRAGGSRRGIGRRAEAGKAERVSDHEHLDERVYERMGWCCDNSRVAVISAGVEHARMQR
jgi:hypothetical protein